MHTFFYLSVFNSYGMGPLLRDVIKGRRSAFSLRYEVSGDYALVPKLLYNVQTMYINSSVT
jgi:hypothetical protein